MNTLENLKAFDSWLFHNINGHWVHPLLDRIMPFVTDINQTKYYLLALFVILFIRKGLVTILILMGCTLAVGIADSTAARVIKPMVNRERPEFATPPVRLLVEEQASESFPSNHAANVFAAAKFLSYYFPEFGLLFGAIAFIVSYSRIYVGVHFPLDVFGGAVLGFFSAVFVHYMIDWIISDYRRRNLPSAPAGLGWRPSRERWRNRR